MTFSYRSRNVINIYTFTTNIKTKRRQREMNNKFTSMTDNELMAVSGGNPALVLLPILVGVAIYTYVKTNSKQK